MMWASSAPDSFSSIFMLGFQSSREWPWAVTAVQFANCQGANLTPLLNQAAEALNGRGPLRAYGP